MYELQYEHFTELGKTCMKFAKYFDQHRALTTRDDAFFTFFLTSVYIYIIEQ